MGLFFRSVDKSKTAATITKENRSKIDGYF